MNGLNKREDDLLKYLEKIEIYKKLGLKYIGMIFDGNYNYLIDEDFKNNELYLDFDSFSEKDFIDDENLIDIINFGGKLGYIIKIDGKEVVFVKLKNNIQKKDIGENILDIGESVLDILANYGYSK